MRKIITQHKATLDGHLNDDQQAASVPPALLSLVCSLLHGYASEENVTKATQPALTISQLIVFIHSENTPKGNIICHKKSHEPPVPLYVCLSIFGRTRNNTIIESMHKRGLSISPNRIMEITASLAHLEIKRAQEEGVLCPSNLLHGLFVIGAYDNIYHNYSSTTSESYYHGKAISIFQIPGEGEVGEPRNFATSISCVDQSNRKATELPDSYNVVKTVTLPSKQPPVSIASEITCSQMSTSKFGSEWKTEQEWLDHILSDRKDGPLDLSWAAFYASKDQKDGNVPELQGSGCRSGLLCPRFGQLVENWLIAVALNAVHDAPVQRLRFHARCFAGTALECRISPLETTTPTTMPNPPNFKEKKRREEKGNCQALLEQRRMFFCRARAPFPCASHSTESMSELVEYVSISLPFGRPITCDVSIANNLINSTTTGKVKDGHSVKCFGCVSDFHFGDCCGISFSTYKAKSKNFKKAWCCKVCRSVNACASAEEDNVDLVSVSDLSSSHQIISLLKHLNTKLAKLQESVNFVSAKNDDVLKQISSCLAEIASLKSEVSNLKTINQSLSEKNVFLENKINSLGKYTKRNNMEIHGIIQTPNENLEENLATLGQAVEVELEVDDIEIAHRLPTRRANRERGLPLPAIVRFASRRKREEVIAAHPVWNSTLHKGKAQVKVSVKEEIRCIQYNNPNAHDTLDVYGVISCMPQVEGSIPEILLQFSHSETNKKEEEITSGAFSR
uniref:Uncharacterized protein n=1 Tax=Timema shepardi TaxID=629360 RepID=A0A7R9AMM6_TIMSH|nr:unnamed protein product [Timema shepardi]